MPCHGVSVCIRALNADAHATWCTYGRMAESSLSRPGWLDSIARTIIARTIIENNDVTTVSENIEMPESLLFKFFVWHAPYVNCRKCADYVDEYSGQSVADYIICYVLRNYVPPFAISIDFYSCAACHWNLFNRGRGCRELFFFLFIRKSSMYACENDGKHPERERRAEYLAAVRTFLIAMPLYSDYRRSINSFCPLYAS